MYPRTAGHASRSFHRNQPDSVRIGFYGNANNYPFILARALRHLGHDVQFVVVSRERLNRPENRYTDISIPYPDWIHDLSQGPRWSCLIPTPQRRRALRLLNSCEFVFLNEEGPSLAPALHRPHAVLFTGSDLDVFADPAKAHTLLPLFLRYNSFWSRPLRRLLCQHVIIPRLVQPQREGIRTACFASYFARGLVPEGDRMLDAIGLDDAHRLFLIMTDVDLIQAAPYPENPRLRLFCATRLTWKHEANSGLGTLDYKGSDIMVRGIAQFHRLRGMKLDIHLVRKGRHIEETRQLAESEGIADQITWHDEMSQKEVLAHFRAADIVIEQLANATFGMAALDALATGRPVITNSRSEYIEPVTREPLPFCHAQSAEQVCAQLQRLADDRAVRRAIGLQSRAYAERHFSSANAAEICLRRMQAAQVTPAAPRG